MRGIAVYPRGGGVYDWSDRDGAALLEEREEELFRHLARDKARGRPPSATSNASS